ncbi:dihydrofolate reductase family protein [Mucilaginibacter myungsuensis]|uniref:Dihydrofolate reductase family protein n=1 Tax=Mucilaginibacter myungsuensis TaxID=649104 RepID=A0A929L0D9_9SPHI|nr:dihydrofolate reductase family protein [Mucilaginibacter myungsuensis]MBE9663932.1 dihydrofolate reductase family protein [Mucilaginibacter myungsuensis]MDN3598352.1 dihydrofolate reductase family protein [Mucilaginibacter myungsuensis]
MRKITVLSFITLDGVMQGPGGPDEDTANDFKLGGWVAPFGDGDSGPIMEKQLQRADLMLGRKTFDIWENYWPKHAEYWPGVNEVTKYVLTNTVESTEWTNVVFVKDIEDIKKVKASDGPEIRIWGSSGLVQLLLAHDLVDEFWLNIHPVILGKGKRLFDDSAVPASFRIVESTITSTGVIMVNYKKDGEVKTGKAGPE